MSDNEGQVNKYHHKKKSKSKNKHKTDDSDQEGDKEELTQDNAKSRNPKAFSFQSHVSAERKFRQ